MRIGIFGGDPSAGTIDDYVAAARQAAEEGFASYWLAQIFGRDALTTLAVIGREVDGIEFGTSVVPTYPRHPAMLAAQTLTTNEACGGRLTLGIGLSHQIVIENMFGYSFDKPVRHMREYLEILMPLINDGAVMKTGETLTANLGLTLAERKPCPVLIAALGSQMLKLAGSLADGTVTWMTGPTTLADHIVPTITRAAEEAGRPAPRIGASLPVAVSDDADDARERAGKAFAVYDALPSYKAMLDREGVSGPAGVAIVGDENAVTTQLNAIADAGVTDFVAAEFSRDPVEQQRTRDVLRGML
jgi:F420-dependent oxidoreductase-like protein